jgi:hypothetical protein
MHKQPSVSRRRQAIAILLPVSDLGELRPLIDAAAELPVIQA